MKILHVLTSPRAEGTPRLVLDWLRIKDIEQQVVFLTPDGEWKDQFDMAGVQLFYNTSFQLKLKNVWKVISLIKKISEDNQPDIVISWTMGFSHWVAIGAKLANVKRVIAHCGNLPGETWNGKYLQTYLSFGLGRIFGNKIIACSEYVKECYTSIPFILNNRLAVVYNAFDANRFKMPADKVKDPNKVVMVAYMEKARDHSTLLHAWKLLENKCNAQLIIIGEGSLRKQLEDLVVELKLRKVIFTGRVQNVNDYLWSAKVYVFSTLYEGFGLTLLEALASECRVVATDVPACREVLQNGKFGKLVPAKNAKALSEAILDALQTSISRAEIDENLNYVSQYSIRNMIKGYLENVGL